MEAAKEKGIPVVVLDRPNPIGGLAVAGPVRDPEFESFIAYHPLPVRHGMTVGELARLFNGERKIGADLHVIPCEGWRRERPLRPHGPALGQPVAQHAEPHRGPPLSRRRPPGGDQPGDRPRHRHALRTRRRPWIDPRAFAEALERPGPAAASASSRSGSRPRSASTPARSAAASTSRSPTAIASSRSRSGSAWRASSAPSIRDEWKPEGFLRMLADQAAYKAVDRRPGAPGRRGHLEGRAGRVRPDEAAISDLQMIISRLNRCGLARNRPPCRPRTCPSKIICSPNPGTRPPRRSTRSARSRSSR